MSGEVTLTPKGELALKVNALQDAMAANQAALKEAKEKVIDARARVKDLNRTLHRQGIELARLVREGA